MNTTRRTLLGATAALAAAPVSAIAVAAPSATPAPAAAAPATSGTIRALWDEVIDLSIRLSSHAPALTAADRGTGLPGWMYVSGEANDLGNARYDRLVAILKAQPASADDVAIMARAATHADITSGPATFAGQRVAMAAMTLAA
ncbi:MAG: hypothetical protein LCH61_08760 [Proteobacteria bacterium]|nr:hypothetical protein [Pseudomonadota bacterium]